MRTVIRRAWRALWARPALALTVVVTLALGVGANAAMLGALGALLTGVPPHLRAPERIARFYTRQYYGAMGWGGGAITSYPVFAAVRDRVPAFTHVAAISWSSETLIGRGAAAERVPVQLVTHEYWDVIGVRPALGRFFDATDDARGVSTPGAVISHEYWRHRFGGDPAVLGRVLEVGGVPVRVVAVTPARFTGLDFSRVDLWLPLVATAPALRAPQVLGPGFQWLQIVARLRDGVAPDVAMRVAAAQATAALHVGDPESVRRRATALVGPLQTARAPDGARGDGAPGATTPDYLRWLALMSGALFLAAVATTAGLLLARALERAPEMAVRYALGARVRHALRDVAVESALLGVLSGGVAVAVAAVFGALVRRLVLPSSFSLLPGVNVRVLGLVAVGTVTAVLPGALVTLIPAWRAAQRTAPGLRAAGRGHVRDARALRPLVAAQVALTFVLLLGAALFTRSLGRALGQRVGYDLDRVFLINLDFPAGTSGGAARRTDTYQRLRERIATLPAIERAALTDAPPLQSSKATYLRVPGTSKVPELAGGGPYVARVEPAYFATMGTHAVAGSLPNGGAPTVVVDARMARTLWPAGRAVGHCAIVSDSTGPCVPVGAVVENARRSNLHEEAAMQYYVVGPFASTDTTSEPEGLLIRVRGEQPAIEATVRAAMRALDPTLPPPQIQRMADIFDGNYAPYRAGATLLSAFAVIATVLCAGGLFGTVSYAAARRVRELGVRAALGARVADNVRLLVAAGLVPAAAGVGAGALAFVAVQRTLAALLYNTSVYDWAAIGAAGAVLGVAAWVASWLPAQRAARADPAAALRAE